MDVQKRIEELEKERDYLLETTPLEITSISKDGRKFTNHTSIKSKYNYRISCLKKYGVENIMDLKEVKEKQVNNINKSWTDKRREKCSKKWKEILKDPEVIKKRSESRSRNNPLKEKPEKNTRQENAKLKAEKAYKEYKEEFGDNLLSTFEEYYNKENMRDVSFKCSICGNPFKTSVYNYRNNLTRCKNCRHEYKSKAIRNSLQYQRGVEQRDIDRIFRTNNIIQNLWKDELDLNFKDIQIRTDSCGSDHRFIKYICKRCGHIGYQSSHLLAKGLLEGTGCSNMCHRDNKGSSYELEICEFLRELGLKEDIDFIRHNRSIVKGSNNYPLELDFYFPKYNLAIEFNGTWYHSYNYQIVQGMNTTDARNYHYNKTKQCEDQGIHLIHIWQHEWIQYKDRIKSIIKGELGLTKNRIYARQCEIREVPQEEYKEFITRLAILRYRNAKHRYGLYYKDRLQMVIAIDYCQSGKGSVRTDKLEIVRSATELDTIVVGGTSKLLKHIIPIMNELYPDIHELVYYVDYDKHLGKSAIGTGAIFDGYSGPSGQNYCAKVCDLVNDRGEVRHLEFGKVYSRIPSHHKAITEAIERDDVWALYTSGTKKFHYNI